MAFNPETGIEGDGSGFVGIVVECNNAYGNSGGDYDSWVFWGPHAGDSLGNISPCLPENNSCGVMMGLVTSAAI